MRRLRPCVALAVALGLVVAVPSGVLAVRLWLVTASPLTLTFGVETAATLTVTNTSGSGGGDEITCVRIQVASTFTVTGASVVSVHGTTSGSAFQAWQRVWPGGSVVTFKDASDGYPLVGSSPPRDQATFEITGVATVAGAMTWTADAADHPGGATSTSCGSGTFLSTPLAFTVLPPLLATPAPSPTPEPTPTPTPTTVASATPAPTRPPSHAPSPTPTRPTTTPSPTPHPSDTVSPSPRSSGLASTSPTGSPLPSPSAETRPSGTPASGEAPGGGPLGPTPPGGAGTAERGGLMVASGDDAERSGTGEATIRGLDRALSFAFGELPGGLFAFSYPTLVLTVPGLLLLLAVLAQTAGALAWLPVVRRTLGGDRSRRRRRRDAPTA